MKLIKSPSNPILSANPKQAWENLVVLNPGVIFDEKKQEFIMLYRAAGKDKKHLIHLGLATSKDGIHFKRKSNQPVLSPDEDNADGGCIEDPRITQMDDWFYVTYASRPFAPGQYWKKEKLNRPWVKFPDQGPSFLKKNDTLTHLAITQDFKTFKKLGRITDSRVDDRDVIIFPEKINGKFVRLSRPMSWFGKGYPNPKPATYIAFSDDLMEWSNPTLLMEGKEWWESKKIGGSCPPIKTKYGWFHIYHGVAEKDGNYRVGAVLLDLKDPTKILARTKDFIMEPELPHELNGYYNGCVFPTGNVVRGQTLYVYYGGADKYVCVATANFPNLLAELIAGKI
jgi:predicted GH43/DUF377 family glycosyl hydrolase